MNDNALDCLVVGAGVVGLAVARSLALRGQQVVVVEREARAGEGVSSRNSGVIHAGLYYPPGSLKARLCVQGRDLLYAYCAQRGVPHRRLGKWVVACEASERAGLEALYGRCADNQVGPVEWWEAERLRQVEPDLRAHAALWVPASGVVDVAELVMALSADVERAGGNLLCHAEVSRIIAESNGLRVFFRGEPESNAVLCSRVVNAAGLGATVLARRIEGYPQEQVPRLYPAAGHYYRSRRPVPFKSLVYPMPGMHGLGVHLGFDLAGEARFGPDVRFLSELDYRFDDSQRHVFGEAIRQWWPALQDDDLLPDFVGIRPKLVGPDQPNPDFMISAGHEHGLPGLIQLFGIESPGLTSSLALGEHVADLLCAERQVSPA
ncbi:NAD(P)/FAD-dependent oxidoreductase [Pseudomarimonas arenosa]|uniref:NAD(P)/FAD-dependent oxidoreductase n=1 Tax=Pseudomarimonas arenosa TaxID=2774145 RepID=A0AAW3ZI66_9GAMM|nr:NAD(P)/FAD-dependent oxidoreductase [Pseudomarimonas arenosa]MBD8525688.1 NAD(P)/FAD-dependent oxidoreductase [Pseudomarimonas arenosa]